MKFKCACGSHILEITNFDIDCDVCGKVKGLWFGIYDIYSKTHKLKKPKLIADTVIYNDCDIAKKKEYNKLVNFIIKHSEKKLCSCKLKGKK